MSDLSLQTPTANVDSLRLFSGHTPAELRQRVARAAEALRDGVSDPGDGGPHGAFRVAVAAPAGGAPLREALEAAARRAGAEGTDAASRAAPLPGVFLGTGDGGRSTDPGKVALLFPGLGSPYRGMLAGLAPRFPYLREWLDQLDGLFRPYGGAPPSRMVLAAEPPEGGGTGDSSIGGPAQAGFACSMALFELLAAARVPCHAMAGFSNGENAALIASGLFRLEGRRDLLSLIHRHYLAEAAADREHGARPSVALAVTVGGPGSLAALEALGEDVFVALDNCPHQAVLVCSPRAAEARVLPALRATGTLAISLPLDRPYHTPLFAAHARRLRALYDDIPIGRGGVPVYSCFTASPFPDAPDEVRETAAAQWTHRVRFRELVARMHADGVRTFVEVGPAGKLTGFVRDTLRGLPHRAVAANLEGRPALDQLHRALAELFVGGVDVDPAGISRLLEPAAPAEPAAPREAAHAAGTPGRRSHGAAPAMLRAHFGLMDEFLAQQQRVAAALVPRFGAPPSTAAGPAPRSAPSAHSPEPVDGRERVEAGEGWIALERTLHPERDAFLRDHALGRREPGAGDAGCPGLPVLPFTFGMELLADAAVRLAGPGLRVTGMREVRGVRWLAADRGALPLRIVARRRGPSGASPTEVDVELFDRQDGGWARTPAFHGRVLLAPSLPPSPAPRSAVEGGPGRCPVERYYRDWLFHGPTLRSVAAVPAVSGDGLVAELSAPPEEDSRGRTPTRPLPAALLDSAGQLVGYWLLERGYTDFGSFPFALDAADLHLPRPAAGARLHARAAVRDDGATVTGDLDYVAGAGQVAVRLRGFRLKHFAFPPGFLRGLLRPTPDVPATRAVPAPPGVTCRLLHLEDPRVLEEAGGIWARALAHVWLTPGERAAWYALPPAGPRRGEWLLGRVAAKDAVRAWAAGRGEPLPPPASIEIEPGPGGAPRVRWTAPLHTGGAGDAPALSISHSGGFAAAALAPAGSRVGVDVEALRPVPDSVRALFRDDELRLGGGGGVLALWCAREAAAKAVGTGLGGDPARWPVSARAGGGLQVAHGGGQIPVHSVAEPGCVLALAHLTAPAAGASLPQLPTPAGCT